MSGGVIYRGAHVLKHWSVTLSTMALSSVDAELIALLKGGTEALGLRSLNADSGREVGIMMGIDARPRWVSSAGTVLVE